MSNYTVFIPARYNSSRLPGKVMSDIQGKTMIRRAWEIAKEVSDQVVVTSDSKKVLEHCRSFGAIVIPSTPNCESGTARIAQAVRLAQMSYDQVIVNLQADEPLMPPENIDAVAQVLIQNYQGNHKNEVASLYYPIHRTEEILDPNVVKVIVDEKEEALYFSRAPIPYKRDGIFDPCEIHRRHIGLYAYTVGFLNFYHNLEKTKLEELEKLEQLRIIYHGGRIKMGQAPKPTPTGVDTPEDLIRVNRVLRDAEEQESTQSP